MVNLLHKKTFIHGIYMEELESHHRLSVVGGEGVHVSEDEVAGAVAVEGGFVFLADDGEGVQHVSRVVFGQAVEVEVECVEAGADDCSAGSYVVLNHSIKGSLRSSSIRARNSLSSSVSVMNQPMYFDSFAHGSGTAGFVPAAIVI